MSRLEGRLARELAGRVSGVLPGTRVVLTHSRYDELVISYLIPGRAIATLREPVGVVRAICQCNPAPAMQALEKQRRDRMRMAIGRFRLGRSR